MADFKLKMLIHGWIETPFRVETKTRSAGSSTPWVFQLKQGAYLELETYTQIEAIGIAGIGVL